ncbi:hypothetical protein AB1Y20_006760 [Prymnesium parvum]|uniref:Nucleotide-diphospho-sugar transferase domain-containing protein n=1 Tax=Prymnesium parvum TaxID=97485 RepID=A0AB34IYQ3_PRYPA
MASSWRVLLAGGCLAALSSPSRAHRSIEDHLALPLKQRWSNRRNSTREIHTAAPGRRLALVTVLSDGHYMERDREAVSLMTCFAVQHNLPYFVETHMFGSNWYNKQLVLRKFLASFDWIMYLDADTYIMNRNGGGDELHAYIDMLQSNGYHVAMSELHHSGVGGFDAGVVLIRNSEVGHRFNDLWLEGAKRAYRNADNGYLNLVFLRWVLGASYDGHCDGLLHKFLYYPNGTSGNAVAVAEQSKEAIRSYASFFPCFYEALGLPWRPYSSARMRVERSDGTDARGRWKPFYISYWDEPGVLSCAYPRRMTSRMKQSEIPCHSPMVYHAKDVAQRFWSNHTGPNATNGHCA